jgi:rhodanese-related sulfurtransferase
MHNLWLFIHSQWSLSLAVLVVVLLLVCVELIRYQRQEKAVSVLNLVQLLNRNQAMVVDLRDTEIYSGGHIIGAFSWPHVVNANQQIQLDDKKLQLLPDKPIVLVCAKGLLSVKLAPGLRKRGFQVQILAGGMQAWLAAEMPVVKAKVLTKNTKNLITGV